ncbi:GGDEF domain-containing protein [Silanimonas lenta]|uniref:GGDEF domain-containing protein n=2 Tax=Silanimonas lenta TaxID=265429 RepID=UPI000410D2D3|nr:GGDEF domain-containing protein [Silanimonas lenta]
MPGLSALARRLACLAWLGLLAAPWPAPAPAAEPGPATAVTARGLQGAPILQRIGPEVYRATPALWSVATAPGKVYVASADGVLVYDGVEWSTVPLPVGVNATLVRRLADGTVMVGGNDTYGRLELDPLQGYRYVDLLATSGLPEADRRLGPVWEILETPDGIYLQSQHFLHLLPARGGDTRSWPLGPDMRSLLSFGGELYARIQGRGLGFLRGGEHQLFPGGETFADTPVAAVLGWGGSRFVVAGSGVWRLDDHGTELALPWPGGALSVYTAIGLDGGGFLVSTLDGELLWVDAGLRLRQRVELGEHSLLDLARDNEGGLWAVTDTEVLRLVMPSPWSVLDRRHGIRGVVADTAEFDGALWVASARGLFRLQADGQGGVRAEALPWAELETYMLLADERHLLVAERNGLRQLRPGQREPTVLHDGEAVLLVQPVRGRSDLAVAVSDHAFFLLARTGPEGWQLRRRWPLEGMAVIDLVQTAPGEFWLSDDRGAPRRWRIELDTATRQSDEAFGADQGLPIDGPDRPKLYFVDGELSAWSKGRTYRFDRSAERFVEAPTPEWIASLVQPGKLSVVETPMGLFAVTPRDLLLRPAATLAWERVHVGGWASTGFGLPRVSRGGVLRVPVWNGILQYAPDGPVPALPPLAVEFDQLVVAPPGEAPRLGEVLRGALELRSQEPIRMRFTLKSLEPGARFRYRLMPLVPDFSDWADRDLSIRGLDPGEYLLEVEGQLPSGRAIAPLRLRLLVTPRLHEEPLLRILALAGFGALMVWASRALGRRRLARVEAQNRLLEQRIADRTLELERANARLAEMAVEDPLTGLHNRRALEQALAREWARCAEQDLPLSALMIDVDHFKRYNDHHGHLEGDRVLVDVAALLRTGLSPPLEMLARYGGEEFTLLLPGTDAAAAEQRAERLCEVVGRARIGVTISIGVAVMYPARGELPMSLLRRADQALYEAKRLGRNRVVRAEA